MLLNERCMIAALAYTDVSRKYMHQFIELYFTMIDKSNLKPAAFELLETHLTERRRN